MAGGCLVSPRLPERSLAAPLQRCGLSGGRRGELARRGQTSCRCSLVRQIAVTAVTGAALGAAAAALQRIAQQHTAAAAAAQRSPVGVGGTLDMFASALDLGWPLQSKEKQLLRTLHDIERQQQREAAKELRRWDKRFQLRSQSLAELRELAQRHGISGRSRMRKGELVTALEAKLDLVQRRRGAAAQPGAPPPPPPLALALPAVHAELAEARAELEQVADDMLAIQALIEEEEAALPPAGAANTPRADGGEALGVLHSLVALSRQLARDASEDEGEAEGAGRGAAHRA